MQREIEALLKAYLQDRSREARLIQDVLTALAVSSAARQRMVEEMATAVGNATTELVVAPRVVGATVAEDVALAIDQLRATRGAAVTH